MNARLILFLLALFVPAPFAADGWRLVWSDEFDQPNGHADTKFPQQLLVDYVRVYARG
jgi:hypothetical protein